ncbi:MAG: fatty acid desaturase [Pseudomonadales bacterium]|nr:fatty acid desaturase [Pseudomonadales bacterium]
MIVNDVVLAKKRRLALITLWTPALGSLLAVGLAFVDGLSGLDIGLFVLMHVITMFGLEVGFHRYFSHKAFKASYFIKVFLAVSGTMAAQGGIQNWVAAHRRHHKYSDQPEDPHSPHFRMEKGEPDKLGLLRGFWHAQMGNLVTDYPSNATLFASDMLRDDTLKKINKSYIPIVALGVAIPTLIGGIATMSLMGALTGFLWGGLVRIFTAQHCYFINGSFCHLMGSKPYENKDNSGNNFLFALINFGSGWHNNHHAFPSSANTGLEWWQFDPSAVFIYVVEKLGLISEVKRPTRQQIEDKKSKNKSNNSSTSTGVTE